MGNKKKKVSKARIPKFFLEHGTVSLVTINLKVVWVLTDSLCWRGKLKIFISITWEKNVGNTFASPNYGETGSKLSSCISGGLLIVYEAFSSVLCFCQYTEIEVV